LRIAGRAQRPIALRAGSTITFLIKGACTVTSGPGAYWTLVDTSSTEDVSKTGKLLDTAAVSPACLGLAGNSMRSLDLAGFRASFRTPNGIGKVVCTVGLDGPFTPLTQSKNRSSTVHNSTSLVWQIVLSVLAVASLLLILIQRRRRVLIQRRRQSAGSVEETGGEEDSVQASPGIELDAPEFGLGIAGALDTLDQTSDPRAAILECWTRFEEAVARAGSPRRASDTPAQTSRRALDEMMLSDTVVDRLCSNYLRARYSPRPITIEMREEMRALVKQVLDEIEARAELSDAVVSD
jgi:hypothetical protein